MGYTLNSRSVEPKGIKDMASGKSDASDLPTLETSQVEAYLLAHPGFLADRPDLMARLMPARALGDGVVDFQSHALRRLRQDLDEMKTGAEQIIYNARSNLSTQARTHDAVLALLAADSFDVFVRTITDDLPMLLEVDLVVLCIERGLPWALASHVQELPPGTVTRLLGTGISRLRAETEAEPMVYGSGTGLVVSDALIRVPVGEGLPPALLALGSRREGTFHAGQATELLSFLASVIARCLDRWMA